MPAGVVVVKRARRRSFALLWAALAWLRSVVSGLRRGTSSGPAPDVLVRQTLFPALAPFADAAPTASIVRACLEACPDECLSMVADGDRVTRLRFDPGRCTGCGRSVEEWGQGVFVATVAPPVLATEHGRVPAIDLLGATGS